MVPLLSLDPKYAASESGGEGPFRLLIFFSVL